MFEQTVAADEVVIEQGADGDFFYVVDKGVYHALIKTWMWLIISTPVFRHLALGINKTCT